MFENHFRLVGKIVTELEVLTSEKGQVRVEFLLQYKARSVSQKARIVCYYDVAKYVYNRCKIGTIVIIEGELWTALDKEDNRTSRRYRINLIAKDVYVPSHKRYSSSANYQALLELYDPNPMQPPKFKVIEEQKNKDLMEEKSEVEDNG